MRKIYMNTEEGKRTGGGAGTLCVNPLFLTNSQVVAHRAASVGKSFPKDYP